MKIVTSPRDLQMVTASWRQREGTVGFVPTMGALHDGHIALLRRAQALSSHTVVSIFVNPLQFGPNEDLARYPRTPEADEARLEAAGCDLLYRPTVADMYPEGFVTRVDPGPLATVLEGEHRPGHFVGVATVVARLLLQVMPDYACFGEKDYQQLQVIRRVAEDLALPVSIVPVPIVRDEDGLALSSRNVYLSAEERKKALALPQTLTDLARKLREGAEAEPALKEGRARLMEAGFILDYLTLADGRSLAPLAGMRPGARLLAAARMGRTRLIDNMPVVAPPEPLPAVSG